MDWIGCKSVSRKHPDWIDSRKWTRVHHMQLWFVVNGTVTGVYEFMPKI